jgi:tetratricopeptide (TPR) repeat protein
VPVDRDQSFVFVPADLAEDVDLTLEQKKDLLRLHARLEELDHWALLGVRWNATADEVRAAYVEKVKLYHPDRHAGRRLGSYLPRLERVFRALTRARDELADDARRAEYVQQLAAGGVAEVDVSAIFKAEELFQRAAVLVKTRQYEKARETLLEAERLNPDEAEFGVWRAWVDYLLAADKKRQHASSAAVIEAALRKVPRCMSAYLFLGQMAKLEGDAAAAERHLKRGLALDPEHADLQRELKYLRR